MRPAGVCEKQYRRSIDFDWLHAVSKKRTVELDTFSKREGPLILRRFFYLSLIAFAFLILTSCSQSDKSASGPAPASGAASGTPAKSSSSSSDDFACRLVTQGEAEAVMGEKLKDPDSGPASMAGGSICRYGSPDSLSAKNVTIRVESPNFNWQKFKEQKRAEGERMQPRRGRIL